MDNNIIQDFQKRIENKLIEIASKSSPKSIQEPFLYLIENGGKRLRPILSILSAGAVGGNPLDALNCGVSLEILHNFTLVHDDIMDSAPLRRGRETIHKKWNTSVGILLGDIMIGFAYKLFSHNPNLLNYNKVLDIFTESLIIVCEGQALDMDYNERIDISKNNYLEMISKKTGNLIKASVLIGAYCGGANQKQVELMDDFATNLGFAFQIQDDYLDLTSEESGKIIGQDLVEGKKTLMVIRAKELAKANEDIELIEKYYKNNGISREEIPSMLNLFEKLGILSEAKELFNSYYEKSDFALSQLDNNIYTENLKNIIYSTRNRKH